MLMALEARTCRLCVCRKLVLSYLMIMSLLRSRYGLGEMYSLLFRLLQNVSSPCPLILVEFARELHLIALCSTALPHAHIRERTHLRRNHLRHWPMLRPAADELPAIAKLSCINYLHIINQPCLLKVEGPHCQVVSNLSPRPISLPPTLSVSLTRMSLHHQNGMLERCPYPKTPPHQSLRL